MHKQRMIKMSIKRKNAYNFLKLFNRTIVPKWNRVQGKFL